MNCYAWRLGYNFLRPFHQPIDMPRRDAFRLETKLHVVQGPAKFFKTGLWVVVGIAVFQQFVNLRQAPPPALSCLRVREGLANHLHQIVQFLIRFVLLDQRGDLLIIQPVALT